MVTHGNIVATTAAVMPVIPQFESKDVYLAYLPLAHVFELAAEVASYFHLFCILVDENILIMLWLSSLSCWLQDVELVMVHH